MQVKINYFRDTDTLYIEFRQTPTTETRDLNENTQFDLDAGGNVCSLTLEQASQHLT